MEKYTLRLIVDKGPKKGETLEHKPGTVIRIGRVVRGNTFVIKDPSISQKHLSIEFNPDTSQWIVSDLDTSNGTFLNDFQIPTSSPSTLSDGDTIKIGATTSISVEIAREEPQPASKKEEDEGGLRRGPRRAAPRARTRAEILDSHAEVDNGAEPPRNGGNRRRHPKKAASARVSNQDQILDLVVEDSIEGPKNEGRGRGRGRRAPARTRKTAASISKEEEPPEAILLSDPESPEPAKKKKLTGESNAGEKGKPAGRGAGEEVRIEVDGDDMEIMTLGEWFDRMEKFLPQAINDASEEIITRLREKALRFNEFVAAKASNVG